jgi:hypothetical protein
LPAGVPCCEDLTEKLRVPLVEIDTILRVSISQVKKLSELEGKFDQAKSTAFKELFVPEAISE